MNTLQINRPEYVRKTLLHRVASHAQYIDQYINSLVLKLERAADEKLVVQFLVLFSF